MFTSDKPKLSYFSMLGRFGNGLILVILITFGFYFSLLLTNSAGFNNVDIADPLKSVFPTMLIAMLFIHIFEGFRVGVEDFSAVVFTSIFAIFFTDVTAIFLLFLYKRVLYNFPGFLLAIVIQTVCVLAWSFIANRIAYCLKKPLNVVVICEQPEDIESYTQKIASMSRQFKVREVIGCRDKSLMSKIDAADGVFIVGLSPWYRSSITDHCFGTGKPCYLIPEPYDVSIRHSQHIQIDDVPVLLCNPPMLTFEQRLVKRIGDIVISLVALIITSPLMLLAAVLAKLDGGPMLYKQERVTYKYRKFNVYKFRTMVPDAEKNGAMLATQGDPRITKAGNFLRRTRLDELPQIFNVLKGDMSFVGPRPERDEFIQEYIKDLPEFIYRLNVKAGLTGLAQVKGKYNTSPKDKLMLDLLYIRNYSIQLDIKILFQTLTVVFMKASTEGVKGTGKTWYKKKTSEIQEKEQTP